MSVLKRSKLQSASGKKSLMQHAYDEIKLSITAGTLHPGDFLDECMIANQLQMSRTPVREAIRLLASENLVEIRNGFGAHVMRLTRKDIKDICVVRRALEVIAAQTALDEITVSSIDRLEERFRGLLTRYQSGEKIPIQEFVNTDFELHEMLVEKCTNRYVQYMMHGILAQVKRYQNLSYEPYTTIEESTTQHLHILQLMRERKQAELERALVDHINWSYSVLPDFI